MQFATLDEAFSEKKPEPYKPYTPTIINIPIIDTPNIPDEGEIYTTCNICNQEEDQCKCEGKSLIDVCGYCKKPAENHNDTHHTFAKPSDICNSCGHPANNHKLRHLFTNLGEKKEFCCLCNVEFSKHIYKDHGFTYEDDVCSDCGIMFKNHKLLRHHFNSSDSNERLIEEQIKRRKITLENDKKQKECKKTMTKEQSYYSIPKPNNIGKYNTYCYYCSINCINITDDDYVNKCSIHDNLTDCDCSNCMWN